MAGGLAALEKALAGGDWPAVVLVTGEDLELRRAAIDVIVRSLPEDERSTAVDRFDEGPLVRALDAARSPSLLGGRRVVIVENPSALAGKDDAAREALLAYLDRPPPCALLVLIADKVDGRTAAAKAIARAGLRIEGTKPREREMPAWIIERARARGLRLTPPVAQVIADAVGNDPSLAQREIEKLALVYPPGGDEDRPDPAVVEQLLRPGRAVGAFELEDAILGQRTGPALLALSRQLAGTGPGESLALLARLAGIARRLAVASDTVGQGGGADAVRDALGCHPFVARKYAEAARRMGSSAGRALAACVRADGMLKSGGNPVAALSGVVTAFGRAGGGSDRGRARRGRPV